MGTVKIWSVQIPQLSGENERRIYLFLPDSYDTAPKKRYPVMYMFDGHNVFFDSDATYGKSWGMHEYMDRAKKDLIIVAAECNHIGNCRLEEYSPVDFTYPAVGMIKGRGAAYMDWLIGELKPYIDAHYRTLSGRDNTLICGSSMGGLMALYGACVYNDVFGRAASLSPSIWVNPLGVLNFIEKATILKDTSIYMDYGSEEMRHHENNMEALTNVSDALLKRDVNLTFRIIPGGTHSEASWERQIPTFMKALGI